MPRIEKNTFTKNTKTGVNTSGNSKAIIRGNTFTGNAIAIIKGANIEAESSNTFIDNKIDIKEAE